MIAKPILKMSKAEVRELSDSDRDLLRSIRDMDWIKRRVFEQIKTAKLYPRYSYERKQTYYNSFNDVDDIRVKLDEVILNAQSTVLRDKAKEQLSVALKWAGILKIRSQGEVDVVLTGNHL